MVIMITVLISLVGCTQYEKSDTSQMYFFLTDNVAMRLNPYQPQLCVGDDAEGVNCFAGIVDPRIYGSWETQAGEVITVYRDEDGRTLLNTPSGRNGVLFINERRVVIVVNDETYTEVVFTVYDEDAVDMTLVKSGYVFELVRIPPAPLTLGEINHNVKITVPAFETMQY